MTHWIVGACIAYFVLGAIVAGLKARIDEHLPPHWLAILVILVWPGLLVYVALAFVIVLVAGDV